MSVLEGDATPVVYNFIHFVEGGLPLTSSDGQPLIKEVVEEIVVEGIDRELFDRLKTQKEEEIMKILSEKGVVAEVGSFTTTLFTSYPFSERERCYSL